MNLFGLSTDADIIESFIVYVCVFCFSQDAPGEKFRAAAVFFSDRVWGSYHSAIWSVQQSDFYEQL